MSMKLSHMLAAAGLIVAAVATSSPAAADRGRDGWHHDRGRDGWGHDRGRHYGWDRDQHRRDWRHHRHCWMEWHHHHRVEVCR
jgi:hypothetical protein